MAATKSQKFLKFRPNYPRELYDHIFKYFEAGGCKYGRAVDVACGSGESTRPLAERFDRVVGVDISEAQVGPIFTFIQERAK